MHIDRNILLKSNIPLSVELEISFPDRLWSPPNLTAKEYRGSFSGVKRPGRETDHSPPASSEIKKMWVYTSPPPYTFMAWCLIS
jgi:hypothetical protein